MKNVFSVDFYETNGTYIGYTIYKLNNVMHREGGPAKIYESDGSYSNSKYWVYNGDFHRLDGLAFETGDDNYDLTSNQYFYHGEHIECYSLEEFQRIVKLIHFD